jgi:DNA polymerase I-like protein with 3'-5' exonuclease and polymerase domains
MKVGIFRDIKNNIDYTVVVNVVQNKGERIEIYRRKEDYSPIDTYNAISAYYRKSREYYYGDSELIREYLNAQNSCITIKGELNQTSTFNQEGFIITQMKVNEQLGLSSKVILVNGIIKEELYVTPNYMIHIDGITEMNTNIFVDPLNIKDYKIISILSDFQDNDTIDADYYSLDYLKSKYPIDHVDNYDYLIIESIEQAEEELKKWKNSKVKIKSIDIESTGLEMSVFGEDLITGVVLSYDWEPLGEVENSRYFPFRQKNFKYNLPLDFLKKIETAVNSQPKAKTINLDVYDGTLIVAHNMKMEKKSFWRDELDVRIDMDTYTLSTLIDTRMERGLHTLKNRAQQATKLFWLELDMVFKSKLIRFDILPSEIVRYYACPDTANTIKVLKWLYKQLPETEQEVYMIENELQYTKANQEYYGLRLNQEGLIKRLKNVEFIVDKLSDIFKRKHNTSKNINSADVLRDIVYNKLGCKVVVRTKKNKPSTSVDAISNIVKHGLIKNIDLDKDVPPDVLDLYGKSIIDGKELKKNKYPTLVILSYYNKYKKELGALRRLQKKSINDRVMFGINGTGAASGRQTSDAHQYSDTMKELVLSDTPEHTLISSDYSQVELRVLAYIIKDTRLIELMKDKHIDIHRAFLSIINGIPVHMISAVMRSSGKRVNFGVVYGISEYGLARDTYGPEYTKEQLLDRKKAITDFFNGIPGCKELADYNRKFVFEHGYIETPLGYRRVLYGVFDEGLTKAQKERIFRAANNTPVQGFAAHLMKMAENNVMRYIKEKGWDKTITYMGKEFPLVRNMLSIHDELLISAHNSIPKEEIVLMCKECMEIEFKDAPPFFAVPTFVENWAQGKAEQFEMSVSMRDDILEAWLKEGKSIVDWDNLTYSINEYKLNQIKDYMESLIRKYKTEEEIIKHVNHPEFTHLLISVYVNKDIVKKNSHEDCIAIAVKEYMNNPDNVIVVENSYEEYKENKEIQDSISYLKDFEQYIEIDDKGQVVLPEEDIDNEFTEEDSEDYRLLIEKEEEERFSKTSIDLVYLGNIAIIDTTEIQTKEDLQKFHNSIVKLCDPKGYYQLNYMRGGSMLPTNLKMDYKQKEIMELISKYKTKEVIKCR